MSAENELGLHLGSEKSGGNGAGDSHACASEKMHKEMRKQLQWQPLLQQLDGTERSPRRPLVKAKLSKVLAATRAAIAAGPLGHGLAPAEEFAPCFTPLPLDPAIMQSRFVLTSAPVPLPSSAAGSGLPAAFTLEPCDIEQIRSKM